MSIPMAMVALLAAALRPQVPTGEVVAGLESRDLAVVAAAARAARESSVEKVASPLLGALRAFTSNKSKDGAHLRLLLLDALIGLRAQAPSEDLLPLLEDERTANAALVLLARDGAANQRVLFQWLGESRWRRAGGTKDADKRARAVGDVLAFLRTPGFAALLLSQADLSLHVRVIGEGHVTYGGGIREPRRGEPPPPFPLGTWPLYTLWVADPSQDSTSAEWLVKPADSGRVGYFRDLVSWYGTAGPVRMDRSAASERPWFGWLRALAQMPASKDPSGSTTVWFEGPDEFVQDVVAARNELDAHRDTLLKRLVANGTLSAEAAAQVLPPAAPRVLDARKDRTVALPALPPR